MKKKNKQTMKTEKKKKKERVRQDRDPIQLSSASNVAMNTSRATFNTELKLAEMATLLL